MIAALLLATLAATSDAHRTVTTTNPAAQAAFDRGLTLLYAYNGDDAYTAFAQALGDDPHLAMAAWGEAIAAGSDLNTILDAPRFSRAQAAAQHAASLEQFASAEERLYVEAVAQRYAGSFADRSADEDRYRQDMAALVAAYPQDDDAAMLDAEAIMEKVGTSGMWSADGTQPTPDAVAVLSLITRVLQRHPQHVFANHLCMHAYDYAHDHTLALQCADRVASWTFTPTQEHLAHMPAHTYLEAGLYEKAMEVSESTWRLRDDWTGQKYAAHDAYTGWSAAMMLGDVHAAEAWALRTGQIYGGSDLWVTWARFGDWSRIANSTASGQFFAPFARGLTDVHFNVMNDARQMLALYGNIDADYRWMLQAAIDEHDGRISAAVDDLNHALAYQSREDGGEQLPLFPAGEAMGALYYRQGRYAESAAAFLQTLQRYPNDPRALYGLSLAQQRLGQAVTSQQTLKNFQQIWTDPTPPRIADL